MIFKHTFVDVADSCFLLGHKASHPCMNQLNSVANRYMHKYVVQSYGSKFCYARLDLGPPRLARPPRPGPCLDFGFQYALIRNNQTKKFGVEYKALPDSNSPR